MSAQPRPRSATLWFAAALLLFVVGSLVAWRQPPRLFPLKPQTTAEWWLQPLEDNAFQRMPRIDGNLNDVFVVPTTGEVWAVGENGLIVHSRDGGRTWERAKTGFGSSLSTEQPKSSSSDLTKQQEYIEKALNSLIQERRHLLAMRDAEANGTSGSGIKGYGRYAAQLTSEISRIESQITNLNSKLYDFKNVAANLGGSASPNLAAIFFMADGQHGWIVGDRGLILASMDGGNTWQSQTSGTDEFLNDIDFAANGQRGWAVGTNDTILTTYNGGKTWQPQTNDIGGHIHGTAFAADGQYGWAVGRNGMILATENGGKSWQSQTSGTLESLNGIAFAADGQRGWAVGLVGTILATVDGGKTWQAQSSGTSEFLNAISITGDGQRGWAVGVNGTILATDNGGKTWQVQTSGIRKSLFSVTFATDGQRGWAIGLEGTILATDNGGKTWQPQSNNTFFSGVYFASDGHRGWAVGGHGAIFASTDGGNTWKIKTSGTNQDLYRVAFATDGLSGWAIGANGTILVSGNGGETWQGKDNGITDWLSGIAFTPDKRHGWAVGSKGTILSSSDGGNNWQRQTSDTTKDLLGVTFAADGQRGWAAGFNGTILATNDGGNIWQPQTSGKTKNILGFPIPAGFLESLLDIFINGNISEGLRDIVFGADGQNGYAVGHNGTILITKDGGKTWQKQVSGSTENLNDVTVSTDGLRGWAVGTHGSILSTINGGKTWLQQPSGTTSWLANISFAADSQHGLAVGNKLTLLTTTNGGETWSPVEYHRYPAPWYFLACLLSLILAALGTRRPQPKTLSAGVADLLASDRPLQAGDADALGYADIAAGLSRFLRNPKTLPPLTLAITGEWGSGKSSLMNLLKADLKKAGFRTVWFNAWHHQKGEQLLASLFANLRAQAIPRWFSRAGWSFRWKLLTRRSRRHAVLLGALLLLLSVSLGYLAVDFQHCRQLFAAGDWAKLNKDSLAALSPWLGGLAVVLTTLVALYNGMKGFGLDPAKLMASVSAGGSKLKPLEPGARYQFAEEFADVTEALAPGRLVIFIDDLDRCSKENVLEVLESVNFLVSSGGCFVVLGMAREWVETCVGLNFKELAEEHNHGDDDKAYRVEFARKYLQKLINIEVPVPKLEAGASSRLMPDKQDLPESGNRLEAMAAAVLVWLGEVRHIGLILLLLAAGVGLGQWLTPQISDELNWVGDKLNGATAKPEPAEIPLPAAMEVKLAPDGGLALGLAGHTKNAESQLLLRADAAELNKGVVLGKLGGAELVLKRPLPVAPVFVKAHSTDPPREKLTPIIIKDTGSSFTSGATDNERSPWHLGPPTLTGLVLLGFGLALLLRSPVKLTEDSDKFMEALKTWHPLIAASCPTPRMVKRYLNWVRFLAMRYRPVETQADGVWLRLSRRLGLAAKPTEPAAETEKVFDEDILVALSAIYQYRREWVVDLENFERLINGGLGALFVEALPDLGGNLTKLGKTTESFRRGFETLSSEDWQRAAEQRERFLAAIGDVDVA